MPLSLDVQRYSLIVIRNYLTINAYRFKLNVVRWEGTGSRVNHEPEDLPGEVDRRSLVAGERARMSCGCNPQGLSRPWGFFF